MAKGAEAKSTITQKILDTVPGSFVYEKEIRIPFVEDGENIQLKCVLTCSKTNVEPNSENALPGETIIQNNEINFQDKQEEQQPKITQMSAEEEQNIRNLMSALGL